MTRAELMALTGRELDLAVAVAVGWRWYRWVKYDFAFLSPPAGGDWVSSVHGASPGVFELIGDGKTHGMIRRAEDWDKGGWISDRPNPRKMRNRMPEYSTDWADGGPLFDELLEVDHAVGLSRVSAELWHLGSGNQVDYLEGATPLEVICRAYLWWGKHVV